MQQRRPAKPASSREPPATYTADMILVHPLPDLVVSGDRCRRTYRYRFQDRVPTAEKLRDLAARLTHVMRVKPWPDRPEVEIPIKVELAWRGSHEVDVSVGGDTVYLDDGSVSFCEEDPVYLYGLYGLPRELDRVVGRVESIEGHPRDGWPVFHFRSQSSD